MILTIELFKLLLPVKYLFILFLGSTLLTIAPSRVEWLVPKEHDFGDIPRNEPVTVDFKFINTSDEPLFIDNVRTTCGCTATNWSEAPVAAGDTSSIIITYNAKKKGYFRKKAKVYLDGQRKAEILYVEGYVVDLDD